MSDETAVVIRGARVIDPYRHIDSEQEEVWVVDGCIAPEPVTHLKVEAIDARGLWLVPRLVDMHVHFREPGQTWKETIATGSRAAAHGGITAVAVMPNTVPVIDTPELVEWVRMRGRGVGLVDVLPLGAVSVGSQGQELADLGRMHDCGARGFSDDGRPVASARLMRAALSYAKSLGSVIIDHAEDPSLSEGALMHEGRMAHRMGLAAVPEACEAFMVWRDVLLAGLTGGALHVAHISAQDSLEALAYARGRGYAVTAEVAPHHLLLTESVLEQWGYDPVTKVNPPLRPEKTRQALIAAVAKGLIGVVASDHAPHHADEKARPYTDAPFGISGVETVVSALITALIAPGHVTPLQGFELMTTGPDRVLGLGYPGLCPGVPAHFALIDPERRWKVDPQGFYSLGRNTPLSGMTLIGQPLFTMVNGRFSMREGEVFDAGISEVS